MCSKKLFNMCYWQYVQCKATVINEKFKKKFDLKFLKERVFIENHINTKSKSYSLHHILPKSIFRDDQYNSELTVPLNRAFHEQLHTKYTNIELSLDPITPIIKGVKEP